MGSWLLPSAPASRSPGARPATARGMVSARARVAQRVQPEPVLLTEFRFFPLMQHRGEAENETVINSDKKLLARLPRAMMDIVYRMLLVAFKLSCRNESWPRGRGLDYR